METPEELKSNKILNKIQACKEIWNRYNELQKQALFQGIYFLAEHQDIMHDSYLNQLNDMRIDLCKERNE